MNEYTYTSTSQKKKIMFFKGAAIREHKWNKMGTWRYNYPYS